MTLSDPFLDRIFYVCGSAKIVGMLWGVILLLYLKWRKEGAKRGCKISAQSLILPIYEPLIYLLIVALGIEALLFGLSHFGVYSTTPIITWAIYEFVRDGLPMVFLQRSVSTAAYKRAMVWAIIPTLHGAMCGLLLNYMSEEAVSYMFEGGAVFYYLCLIAVTRMLKRRESALPYLVFMAIYRAFWVAYYIQQDRGGWLKQLYWPILGAIGLMELPLTGIWYWTMRQDTIYWRTGAPKSYRFKQNKLLDSGAVGLLSGTPDSVVQVSLQNMIESRKRELIDFAYIDIHDEDPLGSGAYSRVYSGTYKNIPVAIKFFSSLTEVTEKTIALYEKETAIMAVMQHPNIVHFYGLCVRPPSIFLIMEQCAFGSLYSLLSRGVSELTLRQRLRLALDACNAIAHIHKLGFIHRDIKSLNFLVTHKLRLKLTDFGLSRKVQLCNGSDQAVDEVAAAVEEERRQDTLINVEPAETADDERRLMTQRDYLTRRVGTGLWMSPEMLQSKPYNEKTDIYSLALVLWEIFAGVPPFEEVRTAQLQHAICVENVRPVIPEACPAEYRMLLEKGWSVNPAERPSALEMCAVLDKLLRRTIAVERSYAFSTRADIVRTPTHSANSFDVAQQQQQQQQRLSSDRSERLESNDSTGSGVSISDIEQAIDINADDHYAPPKQLASRLMTSSSSGSFASSHSGKNAHASTRSNSPLVSERSSDGRSGRTLSSANYMSINRPTAQPGAR